MWVKTVVEYGLIILLVVLVRVYIVTPVQVSGASMDYTLHDRDIMLLNVINYRFKPIKRFEIVVIRYEGEALIKRVIGLPGETIKYEDNKLYIDGKYIEEPFLDEQRTDDVKALTIPSGYYFVLGDNRLNSTDSRHLGLISKQQIKGKAQLVIFPFSRFGFVH